MPPSAVTPASPLAEPFTSPSIDDRLTWTVPRPPAATPTAAGLRVVPFARADLWCRTGPAAGAVANDGAAPTPPSPRAHVFFSLQKKRWV